MGQVCCSATKEDLRHQTKTFFVEKTYIEKKKNENQFDQMLAQDIQNVIPFIDGKQNKGLQPIGEVHDNIIQEGVLNVSAFSQKQTILDRQNETRTKVRFMIYPYLANGLIIAEYKCHNSNKITKFYGSGALISYYMVLTCTHNIFDKSEQSYPQKITFYPGLHGRNGVAYQVARIHFPKEYIETKDKNIQRKNDYALLILKKSTQGKYGYLTINTQSLKENDEFIICGYPQKLNLLQNKNINEKYLYQAKGNFMEVSQQFMTYTVNTDNGQSGGPLLIKRKNQYKIAGIHHGSTSKKNLATRIDSNHISFIKKIKNNIKISKQKIVKNGKQAIASLISSNEFQKTGIEKHQLFSNKQYIEEKILYQKHFQQFSRPNNIKSLIIKQVKFNEGRYYGDVSCFQNKQFVNGNGTLYYNENDRYSRKKYQGGWKDNKKNGYGIMSYRYGKYMGEWKNDKKQGQGYESFQYQNFKGTFKNNMRNGPGQIQYKRNGDKFIGSWQDGVKKGEGIYIWANGQSLKGNFVENYPQGKCNLIYPNQITLIGQFKNGVEDGLFSVYSKNKTGYCRYVNGELKQNQKNFDLPKMPFRKYAI